MLSVQENLKTGLTNEFMKMGLSQEDEEKKSKEDAMKAEEEARAEEMKKKAEVEARAHEIL